MFSWFQEDEVSKAFFILLLLVIVGEFFSAPAITFADSVTLSFLGEDTQNYGRQRMFGSLGKKNKKKLVIIFRKQYHQLNGEIYKKYLCYLPVLIPNYFFLIAVHER